MKDKGLTNMIVFYGTLGRKYVLLILMQWLTIACLLVLLFALRNHRSNNYYTKDVYEPVKVQVGYKHLSWSEFFEKIF